MKQAAPGLNLSTKRTRKRAFLAAMQRVAPWATLVELITPYAPEGRRGRPPFAAEAMLRIHFMQQWFGLSDPAMEEALHDVPLFREFAALSWNTAVPDETTILRFRLLEQHRLSAQGLLLRAGTVVDATLIAAPSSTRNASGQRDPEMRQISRPTACCRARRAKPGAMPAARVPTSGPTPRLVRAGTSPCARENASCWTRPNCATI